MPRVYERKFDWDEAQRLYREGVAITHIANRLGVSHAAVRRIVVPGQKARMANSSAEWVRANSRRHYYKSKCESCGAACRTGHRLCGNCHYESMCKPTVDNNGKVFCTKCERFLEPDAFTFDSSATERGFRGHFCRACDTAARRAYRERQKVPCTGCGKPALPQREKRTHGAAVPRCKACLYEWMRQPEQREASRQRALAARRNGK